MREFSVEFTLTITVLAEDKDDAVDKAYDLANIEDADVLIERMNNIYIRMMPRDIVEVAIS